MPVKGHLVINSLLAHVGSQQTSNLLVALRCLNRKSQQIRNLNLGLP